MFFPGFWSEYGMCSEPAAFGAKCSFPKNEFPYAHPIIHTMNDVDKLTKPNPEMDGLSPFLLNRLIRYRNRIEDIGHKIRFSVSRGPLNIASYLMGTTEFLTNMMIYPDETHKLLRLITDYLIEWHAFQRQTFSSIDGILILDDIVGFIGEEEFKAFGLPYLKELYKPDVTVKFFHNDASCASSIKYYPETGINFYNMAFDTDLNELKELTANKITMLGNIPPRDVLAGGTKQEVEDTVKKLVNDLQDKSRVVFSCGGGMPPDVKTENINAFCETIVNLSYS